MLAGQPPFRGDTALSVAIQHVRTQPERLENLRPDLPPALCRIIHKMLAKDPPDRQQGPRDLLQELRALQIEGLNIQWPAELDELTSVESAALSQASWAATQRLQTVMNSQTMLLGNRHWVWIAALLGLAALLIGGGTAWALRKPFLLNVPASELPPIEIQTTAEQQFLYARSQDTEAAWQSVIDNFNDRLYVPQAEEELALLYLKSFDEADRKKALQLFEHMAKDYPEVDVQWHATGLAGQAIVFSLDAKAKESEEKLVELDKLLAGSWDTPQARRYLDPRMIQMLRSIAARNNKALGDDFTKQFQKKLDTLSEEPGG
jgi:serine/threonine-protein kinase